MGFPSQRFAMAVIAATVLSYATAHAQHRVSFSRVVTEPGLGRLDYVLGVADLDGDGRDDIIAGGRDEYVVGQRPEDRLTKTPLHVFVSAGDGNFRHAPELIDGTIEARNPIVVADDFNGDGQEDFAVFDAGAYVDAHSLGYGNPPQLFLSHADGVFRASSALADAIEHEHQRDPPVPPASGPADLHLKMATSGDIDGDGDVDLWVQSEGGANVDSHLMVNNGDGTFTADREDRISQLVGHNWPPEYWRYHGGHFVDLDNDLDLDLVLGQIRNEERVSQFSIVLVNDGTGHYPVRIELPHAAFHGGFTRVFGVAGYDVNADGFEDLLLTHTRGTEFGGETDGRHVQVLVNRSGTSFVDETNARIGDQSAAMRGRLEDGSQNYNIAEAEMHDVDRDGCDDLVMWRTRSPIRLEAPLVYLNDGRGRFRAMPPEPFAGEDRYFGYFTVPMHVDSDSVIDFVVPQHHDGPDGNYGTDDDYTTFVALLNTTPAGPVRCSAPANQSPVPVGTLPDQTLAPTRTLNVDVSRAFVDPDGDALTYAVSSSAPRVVTARAAGAAVATLTAVSKGMATIRVTARDPGGLSATQSFTVTVSTTTVSTPFTDDPIQPGVTPVRAVHFTELRTRIDALRRAGGLQAFPWTDPALKAGATRVSLVHLLELREALAAAYRVAGRSSPGWTDVAAAGQVPIRAVQVMELRAAVLALE